MTSSSTVCICGGGPAGMMLGLLLARAGIEVTVLEKHSDFLRDFRGDTVHPSTLQVLDDIGLIDRFLALPHSEVSRLSPPIDPGSPAIIDLHDLGLRYPFIAFVPQWDLLSLLAEEAQRMPSFRLLMGAEVEDLLVEEGTTKGLRYRSAGELREIEAVLTIGADGRASAVRAAAGLEVVATSPPLDVLWFRISRRPDDRVEVFGAGGGGQFGIFLNRGEYWQVGMIIPKGSGDVIRGKGIKRFRSRVAAMAPEYADRVAELASMEEVKLLSVRSDRLRRWWKPGLLLIGDAAHAMSPVAGVGINLAIQDAVATFNLLAPALRTGQVPDAALASVQKRRQLPTVLTQRLQAAMQSIVMRRLEAGGASEPPWFALLLLRFKPLRNLGGRFIALGFRPERVQEIGGGGGS